MLTRTLTLLNRLVKLSISLFYYDLCNAAALMRRLTGQKGKGTLVVLTYHSVNTSGFLLQSLLKGR